jgi:hypothetical protein
MNIVKVNKVLIALALLLTFLSFIVDIPQFLKAGFGLHLIYSLWLIMLAVFLILSLRFRYMSILVTIGATLFMAWSIYFHYMVITTDSFFAQFPEAIWSTLAWAIPKGILLPSLYISSAILIFHGRKKVSSKDA